MPLLEVKNLNNPGAHRLHTGWEVAVPISLVYSIGGHLLCAVHPLGQQSPGSVYTQWRACEESTVPGLHKLNL